jgi:hypothetical protein
MNRNQGQKERGKMTGAAMKSNRLWLIFGALFLGFFLYIIYAAQPRDFTFLYSSVIHVSWWG